MGTDGGVGSDETEKDGENKEKEEEGQIHDATELWKGTKEEWRQQLNDLSFLL